MTALSVEHATMPVLGRVSPYASREEKVAHVAEAARQIRIQDLELAHHLLSPSVEVRAVIGPHLAAGRTSRPSTRVSTSG